MPVRLTRLIVPALAALLAGLVLAADSRADKAADLRRAAEKAAKDAEKARENLVKQEVNGQLGEVIKEAYILLSAANKDYDGHRGKAMYHVQEAAKILDAHILKHGSVQQKIKAIQEAHVAGNAKVLDKFSIPIKENQAVSDALLVQAGVVLQKVAPLLVKTNHPGVLGHVKTALQELEFALATR